MAQLDALAREIAVLESEIVRPGFMYGWGGGAMKAVVLLLLVLLLVPITNVTAQAIDPLSALEGNRAAVNAGNVEAAVAFFADDAVITTAYGVKVIGKDAIWRREQANASAGLTGAEKAINPHVSGDTVTWESRATSVSFARLGIAPVRTIGRVVVQNGKIKSLAFYYLPAELVRMQRACGSPQAQGILVFGGLPCNEFVQLAKAHTRSVAATLKPYSAETDFKSLQGYLSPLTR